jgi:hypothetical protein
MTDVCRDAHRNAGARDLVNARFLCWELFLLEDFLLLLHDAASHGEGSGFFQNVVL